MRNLWVFLFRNRAFFWFFAFEFLAFVLIFRFNPYQGGIYFNSSNRIVGGIYQKKNEIQSFLSLKLNNEALADENAQLRKELLESKFKLEKNITSIRDTIYGQQYTYSIAHVVNNTTTQRNNYLTLDQGKLSGIAPNDGVIFPGGILGVVKNVSDHYAVVISILHSESRVSVRLRHTKNFGSLFWNGINGQILSVKDIPNYVEAKKGDTIETSGFSFFPEGLPIGTIVKSGSHNGESSLSIQIKLLRDLNKLDIVYVVHDKFSFEKNALENAAEK